MKSEMEYTELLKRARKDLPKEVFEKSRFEIPKFESFVQGVKTIIKNFTEVARTLHRDPNHLAKFLFIEAGTAGEIKGHRLILKGKKNQDFLNSKLNDYVNEFVLCKQCKKPDTELRSEGGIDRIKCKACGAKYTVRKL